MCDFPHWKGVPEDCRLNNPSYLIRKVCFLLTDEVACTMVDRHCWFIKQYVKFSPKGILMKDLTYVIVSLTYLAEHLDEVIEYQESLNSILHLCFFPPLLEQSSEALFCVPVLQQYFTVFGYLIAYIHDEQLQILVTEVIQRLLTRNEPVDLACVKLKLCHIAMESSLLPQMVGELLEVVSWRLYPYLLDVAFLIISISNKSCLDMIYAMTVDAILLRLDPNHTSYSAPATPEELKTVNYSPQMEAMVFSSSLNVLWVLMRALEPLQLQNHHNDIPAPSQFALWSLRHQLRKEIFHKNVTARNDLLGVTILAMRVFPDMLVVESGLAEDLASIAVATELGAENTWAENIIFTNSQEDLDFKKLLLLSTCFIIKYRPAREIFKKYRVLTGILNLITPRLTISRVKWSQRQIWGLITMALQILRIIIPELPELFIAQKGAKRLLLMIEVYLQEGYDLEALKNCVYTLSSVVESENEALLTDLHNQTCIFLLYRLCNYILQLPHLTVGLQQVLARIFFILEVLTRNHPFCRQKFGNGAIALVMGYFNRVLNPRINDTLTDERLLICVMDFLWECIVWSPVNLNNFIKKGGIYTMLDVIQKKSYPIKLMGLGALVDLVEQGDCVPHLLTWRGQQQESYIRLLIDIWCEEEELLEVKRTDDCCLSDVELPLMGAEQHSYMRTKVSNSSPAILDLLGSIRPKIYAIMQLLRQRYSDTIALVNENYRLNISPLSVKEQVVMKLVENYFALKIGEVWSEVVSELETLGVNPPAGDGEVMHTLMTHQINWCLYIQQSQKRILRDARIKDTEEETDLYSHLQENRLHDTLDALQELDYIVRTTDREFMVARKMEQCKQVSETIQFRKDLEDFRMHRTYPFSTNVTAIWNQKMTINSFQEATLEEDLELVSAGSDLSEPHIADEICCTAKSYSTDCSHQSTPSFT